MSDTTGQIIRFKAAMCGAVGEELKIEDVEVSRFQRRQLSDYTANDSFRCQIVDYRTAV